ncbi:hypothetical protein HII36_40360 [Nonomuraea sp. NN258]|nr:hypothetical protein [Nonomuraea antri]
MRVMVGAGTAGRAPAGSDARWRLSATGVAGAAVVGPVGGSPTACSVGADPGTPTRTAASTSCNSPVRTVASRISRSRRPPGG